ncbi:MAG: hypothetical protein M3256_15605 [Actinomycetota bacterium]|nr:hypothetical protein [Actinomycetota bacterium]
MSSFSDDGGSTFSAPVRINGAGQARAVGTAITLDEHHGVYIAYFDLRDDARDYQGLAGPTWDGKWALYVATSRDGGTTFGPPALVDDKLAPSGRVMLIYTMPGPSLVARKGRVVIAWDDARNGDSDVFLSSSRNLGVDWSPPTRVNDDPIGNGRSQYLPRVDMSEKGRLDVIYYDRRNDPENTRADVYLTSGDARTLAMRGSVRVTSTPSDSRSGEDYLVPSAQGLVDFGSRLASLSEDNGLVAAWTDTRDSPAPPYQDIFAAPIELSESPSGSPHVEGMLIVAAAVALSSATAVSVWRRRRHASSSSPPAASPWPASDS